MKPGRLKIEFSTDNAAFENDLYGECARILKTVVEKIEQGVDSGVVYDVNGNRVGEWSL